jgi:hypothetical protein
VRVYTIACDETGPLHGGSAAEAARPRALEQPKTSDGITRLTLPAQSWTVLDAR